MRCSDFLPPLPPHFVAFAWRYHPTLVLRSVRRRALRSARPGPQSSGRPIPLFLSGGDDRISQVPCEPLNTCPAPSTPTEDSHLDHSAGGCCCLPHLPLRRPPQLIYISGLNHAARDLAVYASQPRSPSNHATLASDWCGLTFVGRDLHPLGSNARFQGSICLGPFPRARASPGAR